MEYTTMQQPSRTLTKTQIYIGSFLLLIIIVSFSILLSMKHKHDEQLLSLQSHLTYLKGERKILQQTVNEWSKIANTLTTADKKARDAGQKRHDLVVAESLDTETELQLAQIELDNVRLMQDTESRIASKEDTVLNVFSSVYGKSDTQQFRSDIMKDQTLVYSYLQSWARAIGDIRDYVKEQVNGGSSDFNDSDNEHFYSETDQTETQEETQFKELNDELLSLTSRLDGDIKKTQDHINSLTHNPFSTVIPRDEQ